MYKVKFTPYRKELGEIMYRQTAGGNGFSDDGKYRFFISDDMDEADFWVVQGKGLRHPQHCNVAPENTLLLTTEPKSVLTYPQRYIRQFGVVGSCQPNMKHKRLILSQPVLPWFVGYKESDDGKCTATLTRDNLKNSATPQKTKLLSVITSNKAFTKGHLERIAFVEKLKAHYGDKIDVFGRGYKDFDDKWEVLSPYKYHIVIENSSQDYYWTEKISDCFLSETFPFYYGCTNLSGYFREDAFIPIDIRHPEKAMEIIDQAIADKLYNRHKSVLNDCKQKVLGEFNMFNFIASICDTMNPNAPKQRVEIKPCRSLQSPNNLYNYFIRRNMFKMKQYIKNAIHGKSILE